MENKNIILYIKKYNYDKHFEVVGDMPLHTNTLSSLYKLYKPSSNSNKSKDRALALLLLDKAFGF